MLSAADKLKQLMESTEIADELERQKKELMEQIRIKHLQIRENSINLLASTIDRVYNDVSDFFVSQNWNVQRVDVENSHSVLEITNGTKKIQFNPIGFSDADINFNVSSNIAKKYSTNSPTLLKLSYKDIGLKHDIKKSKESIGFNNDSHLDFFKNWLDSLKNSEEKINGIQNNLKALDYGFFIPNTNQRFTRIEDAIIAAISD